MGDLAKKIGLDAAEIDRRKRFLELGDDDIDPLRALHDLLRGDVGGAFVNEFYAHLLAFDETRRLLQDPDRFARLKQAQAAYFDRLTIGLYDASYVEDRLRVGIAHERVGLDPQWYIGAYRKYLSLLITKLWQPLSNTADTSLQALLKVVFLDMGIAIDAYISAAQVGIKDKAEHLSALNQIAVAISSVTDIKDVLDKVMRLGIALTGSQAACVALYNSTSQRFEDWHTQGLSEHFVQHMSFRSGGLADEVFTTGVPVISNDRPETQHKLSRLVRSEAIRAFICFPLVVTEQHRPLGVLYFYRGDRETFQTDEIELLDTFSQLAAVAIENSRLHAHVVELAMTDALTGLPNRRAFEEQLQKEVHRAERYGRPFSLMMLDIDHFKIVNDTYGHPVGDVVLHILADLLTTHIRKTDFVARYGGEEFTIILPETTSDGARQVGEHLCHVLASNPITVPHHGPISITVSIGIASFPQLAERANSLCESADRALYTAKRSGRNQVCLYQNVPPTDPKNEP